MGIVYSLAKRVYKHSQQNLQKYFKHNSKKYKKNKNGLERNKIKYKH